MLDFTQDTLKDLRDFVRDHSEALQNASFLLGSQPWLKRMQAFISDVMEATFLTRRLEIEVRLLVDFLSLENVHDVDRIEAACFIDLDPASPYVEEICLLVEALSDRLCRLKGRPLGHHRWLQTAP
jgi:hypothetical protein